MMLPGFYECFFLTWCDFLGYIVCVNGVEGEGGRRLESLFSSCRRKGMLYRRIGREGDNGFYFDDECRHYLLYLYSDAFGFHQ